MSSYTLSDGKFHAGLEFPYTSTDEHRSFSLPNHQKGLQVSTIFMNESDWRIVDTRVHNTSQESPTDTTRYRQIRRRNDGNDALTF